LINFVDIKSHNLSFKNSRFLALKNIAKKMANISENSYFRQYLPNLAPYGNPVVRLILMYAW